MKIKLGRERLGLSQRGLAAQLHVSQSWLSALESGASGEIRAKGMWALEAILGDLAGAEPGAEPGSAIKVEEISQESQTVGPEVAALQEPRPVFVIFDERVFEDLLW